MIYGEFNPDGWFWVNLGVTIACLMFMGFCIGSYMPYIRARYIQGVKDWCRIHLFFMF